MSARWKFNDGLAEGSPTCANPKSSSSSGLWKSADFPTKSAFGKLVFAVASGLCFALIAPRAWCAQQGAGAVPSVPEEAEKQYQKALEGFQDRSKPIDIQSFQDVAAKATNCAAAHAILAWAYFLSSTGPEDVHSSDIMKELDIAVSLEPNNPKVYVTRGTLKFRVGDIRLRCRDQDRRTLLCSSSKQGCRTDAHFKELGCDVRVPSGEQQ